jgi:hypothetical protein
MKLTHLQFTGEARWSLCRCLRFCLPTALVLAVLTGCAPKGKIAGDVDPVGTYALISVDGKNVPCALEHEGHSITVKSGSFVIQADGTCASKIVFVPPSGSDFTREVSATYTRNDSKLTMQWKGAGTTIGTVDGNTFTMNNEGMLFAYRK